MASFGLSNPWIASYNPATGKYKNGFKCGEAIETSVTPNSNEASLFGDNKQIESVAEFKNANVSLGVTKMPIIAAAVVFGHKVNDAGEEISNAEDSAGYVGYGFITAEMEDGIKKYRACVLYKVKFKEGEDAYSTKGDSIVFKTPTLSGIAMARDDGEWRKKSPYFNSLAEADLWIQKILNVVETCETPEASVAGGDYNEQQSVTLKSDTAGASIRYTTDGTTPSATNGTLYDAAITIAKNTGLRAVAYKDGAEPSGVMLEEYFITE